MIIRNIFGEIVGYRGGEIKDGEENIRLDIRRIKNAEKQGYIVPRTSKRRKIKNLKSVI